MRPVAGNLSPRISGEALKKKLVAFARELGFDSCRVAACAPPPHATEFRNWLRVGSAGEMHYMERGEEKRCDPQNVLPGTRSIIVVALNYFQGHTIRPSQTAATGKIARYAWGDDYHNVIAAKLDKIDNFLREFDGRQKHDADRSAFGHVVFSRRDFNNARSASGRSPTGSLWKM